MKFNFKKSLKIVTLLITSLLIATASATVYNYLYQNATIGVEGLNLSWVNGSDYVTAGTQISGSTCTLTNLKGPANGTRVYSDPVRLKATADTTFNLRIDDVGGSTNQMASITVRLYNMNSSSYVWNMTVWDGTSKGADKTGLSITSGYQWRFEWEIKWKVGATGTVTVKLKVEIPS
jgi:hypothetical protein